MEKRTKNFSQKYFTHKLFGKRNYGRIKFFKILLKHKLGREYEITKFLKRAVEPGDVFFDIGANMGQYSLRINDIYRGKVNLYVFEPSNLCFNILKEHFSGSDNVKVEHNAVSDYSGKAELSVPVIKGIAIDTQGTINRQSRMPGYEEFRTEEVDVISLDDYVTANSVGKVDFIKSDTEGEDGKVIMGGKETIKLHHPVIITEDILSGEPYEFLKKTGYDEYTATEDGFLYTGNAGLNAKGLIKDVVIYIHKDTADKFKEFIL